MTNVRTACGFVFAVAWAVAALHPVYPRAFWLENLPFLVALPALFAVRRTLSDRAWVQLTLFGLLHLYGAHYTYANTPVGAFLRDAFALQRNHYDRLVHFAFGLLVVRPIADLLPQRTLRRERLVAFAGVSALSLLYEQLEWATMLVADPSAGAAFLGAQGDPWDAQEDTACASLGALVAIAIEVVSPSSPRPRRTPSSSGG